FPCHTAGQSDGNDRRGTGLDRRMVPRRLWLMSQTILRGRVLSFVSEPQGLDDTASYRYFEDGGIVIVDGKIVAVDAWPAIAPMGADYIDHRPHLILPGFIDMHLHYVQS